MDKYGLSIMSHILDDFIFIGPRDTITCQNQLDQFLHSATCLGIPIRNLRLFLPQHVLLFMVFKLICRPWWHLYLLPRSSLSLSNVLQEFSKHHTAHLRLWQSVICSSYLSFACKVIRPGRPLLRCLIHSIQGVTNATHHVSVSLAVHCDCAM